MILMKAKVAGCILPNSFEKGQVLLLRHNHLFLSLAIRYNKSQVCFASEQSPGFELNPIKHYVAKAVLA
jgi:hypothetical protein